MKPLWLGIAHHPAAFNASHLRNIPVCVPPTSTPDVKFNVDAPVGAANELVTSGAPTTKFPWSSVLNTGAVGPVYCTVDAGRKSGKDGKGGRR